MAPLPESLPVARPPAALAHQLKQVALTYLTHRYLWMWGAILGLMILPQLLAAGLTRSETERTPPFFIALPVLMVPLFLVGQAKMQFAHARSRVMPTFLTAHTCVLVGILLALFLLYPLSLALLSRIELLGPFALLVAIGAPIIWGTHLNRFVPMLIAIVIFYSLFTSWGHHWWITEASRHRIEHMLIAIAGVALIVAWLWRLSHLTEEMDDYQNVYQVILARRTGAEAIEQRRIIATQIGRSRLAVWIGDKWHARLGGYHGGNRTARARLLRYGFGAIPAEATGLFIGSAFLAITLFFGQFASLMKLPSGAMGFYAIFPILMFGQMAGEAMAYRRARIANELLLPLTRGELISALFAATIRNTVILWLLVTIAIAVAATTFIDRISPSIVALFVLLSASSVLASMGVSLHESVWPSFTRRLTVQCLTSMLFVTPIVAWWNLRDTFGDAPFLLVAALLVAIGLWLIRAARRAWLNLELG